MAESCQAGSDTARNQVLFETRDVTHLGRGDVVLFGLDGQTYLKRIYAIAGDIVWEFVTPEEQGAFPCVVPDHEFAEAQSILSANPGLGELVRAPVPAGHIVVLGDAGSNSYDSRFFGALSARNVRGRVIVPRLFNLWSPDVSACGVAMAGGSPSQGPALKAKQGDLEAVVALLASAGTFFCRLPCHQQLLRSSL